MDFQKIFDVCINIVSSAVEFVRTRFNNSRTLNLINDCLKRTDVAFQNVTGLSPKGVRLSQSELYYYLTNSTDMQDILNQIKQDANTQMKKIYVSLLCITIQFSVNRSNPVPAFSQPNSRMYYLE